MTSLLEIVLGGETNPTSCLDKLRQEVWAGAGGGSFLLLLVLIPYLCP